jgi:hypothetical protein
MSNGKMTMIGKMLKKAIIIGQPNITEFLYGSFVRVLATQIYT